MTISKLLTIMQAEKKIARLKSEGNKVVFTNGCFDLIHVGHIRMLKQARQLGSFLLVALNSDKSIQQLKGPQRPLTTELERAEILSAIAGVDAVVIFDQPDCSELIEFLKPNICAKGTDYTRENYPERQAAKNCGAEIVITGDPKNHSTAEIMTRITEIERELTDESPGNHR